MVRIFSAKAVYFALMLAATALIGAGQANAYSKSEIKSLAKKVAELSTNACATGAPVRASIDKSKPIQMVFLRGFNIDIFNNGQAGYDMLDTSKQALSRLGYKVKTMAAHWTGWRGMCEELLKTPKSEVILMGHSYGATGAEWIAECLNEKGIETSLMLTFSSFDFLTTNSVAEIKPYIRRNYNFWVTDPVIAGRDDHKAVDPNKTFVQNTKVNMTGVPLIGPHLFVTSRLVGLSSLLSASHAAGTIDNIRIPASISADKLDSKIKKFSGCSKSLVDTNLIDDNNANDEI